MRIDLWSDIVCPYCWVGITHFRRGLALLGDTAPGVEVRWRTFLLDPDADETPVPLAEVYARKFGGPEQARAVFQRVEAAGRAAGLPIDLGRGQVRVTTKPAHRLLWLARRRGADTEAVAEALFRAHFEEGRNLAEPGTLADAAAAGGMAQEVVGHLLSGNDGAAGIREDLEQARRLGISAVPFFVLDGRLAVRGAQPPEAFAAAIWQVTSDRQDPHLPQ